jgi:hypothetical protein
MALFSAVLLAAWGAVAQPSGLRLADWEGKLVDPFEAKEAKAIVFVFVATDCPISNRYAPEIRRLQSRYGALGVVFWLVYPDPDTSAEAIRKHRQEYQYSFGALRDPKHALVAKAKVRVTPEAAVFLANGNLVYHGRIDDRYVELGKERPSATTHDLQDVLQAIVDGRPVARARTRAVGCYIPDVR